MKLLPNITICIVILVVGWCEVVSATGEQPLNEIDAPRGPPFSVEHCLDRESKKFALRATISQTASKKNRIGQSSKVKKDWPPESVLSALTLQHQQQHGQQFKGFQKDLMKKDNLLDNDNGGNDPILLHLNHAGAGRSTATGISHVLTVTGVHSHNVAGQRQQKPDSSGTQRWGISESESFINLVETFGMYRIRIPLEKGEYVLASIPACELLLSNFHDEIELRVGMAGYIIGLSYRVVGNRALQHESCLNAPVDSEMYQLVETKVKQIRQTGSILVKTTSIAVFPDIGVVPQLSLLKKDEKKATGNGKGKKEEGEAEEDDKPKGLLDLAMKYWYYIVPMLIMFVLMPGDGGNEEGGGEGGQN